MSHEWLTINNAGTKISAVLDAGQQRVWVAHGSRYAAWETWYEIDLNSREMNVLRMRDKRLDDPDTLRFEALVDGLDMSAPEGLQRFLEAVQQSGLENMWLLHAQGSFQYRLGRHAECLKAYDRLIARYPQVAEGYKWKGYYLHLMGNEEKAARMWRQGLSCPIQSPEDTRLMKTLLKKAGAKGGS